MVGPSMVVSRERHEGLDQNEDIYLIEWSINGTEMS